MPPVLGPWSPAQDYKRIFPGDQGPITGGMGSYCPVPGFEQKAIDAAMEHVVEPMIAALRKRDIAYRGVLYAAVGDVAFAQCRYHGLDDVFHGGVDGLLLEAGDRAVAA